jgi:hypothetical protein
MRIACLIFVPLALMTACAAPPTQDEPARTLADVNDCVTGTHVCRRDGRTANVQTVSGAGAREALDRMRPTGTQPITSGSSR